MSTKEEEEEAARRAAEGRRPHALHAAFHAAIFGFCNRCGAARIVGEPHASPCKPSSPPPSSDRQRDDGD